MSINLLIQPTDILAAAHHSFVFKFSFSTPPVTNQQKFLVVQLIDSNSGAEITTKQYYEYRASGYTLDFSGDLRSWVKTTLPSLTSSLNTIDEDWGDVVLIKMRELTIDLDTGIRIEDSLSDLNKAVVNVNYQFDESRVLNSSEIIICTHKPDHFVLYRNQHDWISLYPNNLDTRVRYQGFRVDGSSVSSPSTTFNDNDLIHVPIGHGIYTPNDETAYTKVTISRVNPVLTTVKQYTVHWKNCPYNNVHRELVWVNPLGGVDSLFFEESSTSVKTTKKTYRERKILRSTVLKNRATKGTVNFKSDTEEIITLSRQIDLFSNKLQWKRFLNGMAASNNYFIAVQPQFPLSQPNYLARFIVDDFSTETSNDGNRVNLTIKGRLANLYQSISL